MDDGAPDVSALGSREPGEDPEDPYADTDLDELPDWWRPIVREFEEAGLRPYRPPRFTDGELTPEVIERLEAELDVSIRFRCFEARYGDDWEIQVDGEPVRSIGRHRATDGASVYELSSDEFADVVESAA